MLLKILLESWHSILGSTIHWKLHFVPVLLEYWSSIGTQYSFPDLLVGTLLYCWPPTRIRPYFFLQYCLPKIYGKNHFLVRKWNQNEWRISMTNQWKLNYSFLSTSSLKRENNSGRQGNHLLLVPFVTWLSLLSLGCHFCHSVVTFVTRLSLLSLGCYFCHSVVTFVTRLSLLSLDCLTFNTWPMTGHAIELLPCLFFFYFLVTLIQDATVFEETKYC